MHVHYYCSRIRGKQYDNRFANSLPLSLYVVIVYDILSILLLLCIYTRNNKKQQQQCQQRESNLRSAVQNTHLGGQVHAAGVHGLTRMYNSEMLYIYV